MPRYFFDLREGTLSSTDEEGAEFATLKEAESEAVRALADTARSDLLASKITDTFIIVRNEAGDMVLTVSLRFDIVRAKP